MRYLLLLLFLVGCGRSEDEVPASYSNDDLSARMASYKSLIAQAQDENGFIYSDECDSLLFTSLAGIALDNVNIRAAREENGRWHRRPAMDCYPDHSKSTISRDMLLGVLWYAYWHNDLELAERLWSYGSARSWIMGDGLRNRTLFTPALIGTLAQLIKKLGGEDHRERHIPAMEWPGVTDFEAHLQILHILLRLHLYGSIDGQMAKRLEEQAAREPNNALFQYAAGNSMEAVRLLLEHFPADRLPTSDDHCERWLYQRDYGPAYMPCSPYKQHSGGELLFLGTLLGGKP